VDEHHITNALQAGVTAALAAAGVPTLPTKYIGISFTTPADGKWLEVIQLPNNLPSAYWGEEGLYRGILRLILHWPADESGAVPPLTMLGNIAAFFSKDKMLAAGSVVVKVTEKPNLTGLIEASGETIFPVSIRYQCFKV
jgi:hypothetical protein